MASSGIGKMFVWCITFNYVSEFNTMPVAFLMLMLNMYMYKTDVFHCIRYVICVCVYV